MASSMDRQQLETLIDAFEEQLAAGQSARLQDFLPPADHPGREQCVVELVRVELEHVWRQGKRPLAAEYRDQFPELFQDSSQHLSAIVFEEYRLRCLTESVVSRSQYTSRYGVDTSDWPSPEQVRGDSELCVDRCSHANNGPAGNGSNSGADQAVNLGHEFRFPQPPDRVLEFELVALLGRGSFSRVYLARQDSLANRFVVLKASAVRWSESELLARLQHTNIVPIHSVHHHGELQYVCMPFLGASTLTDLLNWIAGCSRSRRSLPESGAALLSTVNSRQAATLSDSVTDATLRASLQRAQHDAEGSEVHRLQHLNYSRTCLWIASEIADGLSHAHERGIVHRDLKPANVLITDPGRPMLLDFNLSHDAFHPDRREGIGGTLPYMSPEQLRLLAGDTLQLDHRTDLYSLGVILYELLSGRRPFPDRQGNAGATLRLMVEDRKQPPPSIIDLDRDVTPAVESIVRKCLAGDRNDRYQTADELLVDVDRHLKDLPLKHAPERSLRERGKKWLKRHPKLASASGVAGTALLLVGLLLFAGWRQYEQSLRRQAIVTFQDFQQRYQTARASLSLVETSHDFLRMGQRRALEALASLTGRSDSIPIDLDVLHEQIETLSLSQPDAAQIKQYAAELLFLLAGGKLQQLRNAVVADREVDRYELAEEALLFNRSAGAFWAHPPQAILSQRAAILDWLQRDAEADAVRKRIEVNQAGNHPSPHDSSYLDRFFVAYLDGLNHLSHGRWEDALNALKRATELQPLDFAAWLARGNALAGQRQFSDAVSCYTVCSTLRPESHLTYFYRGLCFLELNRAEPAEADFRKVLETCPESASAYLNLAQALKAQGRFHEALAVADCATQRRPQDPLAYLLRAKLHDQLGQRELASKDRQHGLTRQPVDAYGWVARAMAELSRDPHQAWTSIQQALKLDPCCYLALRNGAHILADHLNKPQDAIRLLDRILESSPHNADILASRGVLNARSGNRNAALEDGRSALQLQDDAKTRIHVACIFAITGRSSEHRDDLDRAIEMVQRGLAADPAWVNVVRSDSDLSSIRQDDRFQTVVRLASELSGQGERNSTRP